jgi:hypothetical protein
MLFNGLANASSNQSSFRLFTEGTCGMFTVEKLRTDDFTCEKARRLFIALLDSRPVPVLIGQRWKSYLDPDESFDNFASRVVHHLNAMTTQHPLTQFIIMGQIPEMPGYGGVYECLTRFAYLPSRFKCDSSPVNYESIAANRLLNRSLKAEIEKKYGASGRVIFIDPFDFLCNDTSCVQMGEGSSIFYSDHNHLSLAGSDFLIQKAWPHIAHTLGLRR